MDPIDRQKEETASDEPLPNTADLHEHEIPREKLVNRLNYINFKNGTVQVNFRHTRYERHYSRIAYPQPCIGNYLVCLWSDTSEIMGSIDSYCFKEIIVPNGTKVVAVTGDIRRVSQKGICLRLPAVSRETNLRKMNRHDCDDLVIQLIQHGIAYKGELVNFNAMAFHVMLKAEPPQTFQWINPKTRANLTIQNGNGPLYSGECRIMQQTINGTSGSFILEPLNQVIQRYKPKEYRSKRFQLHPSPDMFFKHPFTRKTVSLKVFDLAGSGFSVEDDQKNSVLMAGMIIPELELNFANSFRLKGKAQVVYRKSIPRKDSAGEWIKCGIALLDMDPEDHRKLMAILQQADNRHAYICNKVDLDDLWQFFFETGFIYPQKYAFIQAEKEKIKATYEKLYLNTPGIARHFIYQENNAIRGHMSMLRFYRNTWLIQHHAARSSSMLRAGLIVLDQIGRFTYESHRLYSSHMNYLMCYYRPDNTFPQHVFGGAANSINDPKGCSVDTFAYCHYRKMSGKVSPLPPDWDIVPAVPEDLLEFGSCYESIFGGLLLEGLDLIPGAEDEHGLIEAYQKAGLKRERSLLSLRKNGRLFALLMVDMTDTALNMSDLTNGIKCFVIEQEELLPAVLFAAIARVAESYEHNKIPLLIHPLKYIDRHAVPYEKQYCLWLLNTDFSDSYFKFIDELNKSRKDKKGAE